MHACIFICIRNSLQIERKGTVLQISIYETLLSSSTDFVPLHQYSGLLDSSRSRPLNYSSRKPFHVRNRLTNCLKLRLCRSLILAQCHKTLVTCNFCNSVTSAIIFSGTPSKYTRCRCGPQAVISALAIQACEL